MSIAYRIRRAGPEDLDALSPLFDAYRVFYEQPSDLPAARQFLQDRMEHLQSVIFLAELTETGTAIGFTQLYPTFSSVSMKRVWILNDLFVEKVYRGLQAGKALLDAARDFGLSTRAKGLQLETARTNTTAQRLYETYGYHREVDAYFYFLPLNP